MALDAGTVYYQVEADTSKLVNGSNAADASLDALEKQFGKTDAAAAKSSQTMTKTAAAAKQLGDEAGRANKPLDAMSKLLFGLVTVQGINTLIQMAERYGEMAERIRFATASQEEYEMVQQRLLATANGTYRALSEVQEGYILTADSLRSMGYSTSQVLDITDSLAYSFVKNATAVDRAQNAQRAYTNAINKGKVETDGWMTIISAIPTVIQDVAAATNKTAAEIRQMGASGQITAQMLNEGLRKSLESNKAAADGMATTVRDAFTNMRTNISAYIGELNLATGSTNVLSSAIMSFGNNIDVLAKALLALAGGALAAYAVRLGAATVASLKAMVASRALAAEELRLAQAHAATAALASAHAAANAGLSGSHGAAATAATAHQAALQRVAVAQAATSLGIKGLVGLLGGPAGLIFMLGTAAASFLLFGDNAKKALPALNELAAGIENLGAKQLDLRKQQAAEVVQNLEKAANEAGVAVKALEKDQSDLAAAAKRGARITQAEMDNVNKTLVEQRAAQEAANQELEKGRKVQADIAAQQAKNSGAAPGGGAPKAQADPEVAKRLAAQREELELAKLTGVARARLQAIQKLGANATAEERKEAAALASEIYRLEDAQSRLKKATTDQASEAKKNAEAIKDMREELAQAALSGEALAVAKAKAKLNKFATKEEVAEVERLAKALHAAANEEERLAMLRAASIAEGDAVNARNDAFQSIIGGTPTAQLEKQRDVMKELADAYTEGAFGIAGTTEAIAAYGEAVNAYLGNVSHGLDENTLFAQKAAENIQDYLGESLFNIMEGNFKNIGQSFLSMMNRMVAEAAAADLAKHLLGGLVKGGSGDGLLGGVLSSAGSFFGGLFGGGKAGGGAVQAGKAYRVNEMGRPEVLNVGSRQYMIPTKSGSVDARPSGGGITNNISVSVDGAVDARTRSQIAADIQQQLSYAGQRFS